MCSENPHECFCPPYGAWRPPLPFLHDVHLQFLHLQLSPQVQVPPKTQRKGEKGLRGGGGRGSPHPWGSAGMPWRERYRDTIAIPPEHPLSGSTGWLALMFWPCSAGRSQHSRPLPSEMLQMRPPRWERISAAGPARMTASGMAEEADRREGVLVVPPGCSASRSPPGLRQGEALAYPWRKGSPGSPCLPGPAVGCQTRWAMGRAALAGLAAASYLSLAGESECKTSAPRSLRTAQPGTCPGRC